MNVRFVYVSADHKGVIALGKPLGKLHALSLIHIFQFLLDGSLEVVRKTVLPYLPLPQKGDRTSEKPQSKTEIGRAHV